MITAKGLSQIEVKSTYQERMEKAFNKQMRRYDRFLNKKVRKAQQKGENKIEFFLDRPNSFTWSDYYKLIESYFTKLGYMVDINKTMYDYDFRIYLYW